MNVSDKIRILGESAQYDICAACGTSASRVRSPMGRWIYPSSLPDGRTVLLFKVLMTNSCKNDCFYCVNRRGGNSQRVSFKPEELASLFMNLYRERRASGLFLSSAVSSSTARTMEDMIKTVEVLRERYQFPGYVHLKILPGAGFDYVERAVEIASRVSLNLEAPTSEHLKRIARNKDFEKDILLRMKWVKSLASSQPNKLKAGQTTQFVVGAADESDHEILQITDHLYKDINLTRAYFSAFQPLPGTPLEDHPATPLAREHRLYQADFLFRRYGFKLQELIFDRDGNLPLNLDPKMAWALSHPERFPVEINKAEKDELLRVPGIGPKSAGRIVAARLKGKIDSIEEVKRFGTVVKWAAPFILINGISQAKVTQLRRSSLLDISLDENRKFSLPSAV